MIMEWYIFCACLLGISVASWERRETSYDCEVSEWSPWGPCMRVTPCNTRGGQRSQAHRSFPKPQTEDPDVGRTRMAEMRREKERQWAARGSCKRTDSCPKIKVRSSEGIRCQNGGAAGYPCHNIDLLAYLDFDDLGSFGDEPQGSDIWGWTDELTLDEYAIIGLTTGTSFVRITNPVHPVVLGFLPTRTTSSPWRDMKVVQDHVYIVSEAYHHGMQVFDLTQLRSMTRFSNLTSTLDYTQFGNAHNIVANQRSGYVYVVGATQRGLYRRNCRGGLHMVDVNDPTRPVFNGCYPGDGYTHDAQCVIYHGPDENYIGREICFNYNEDTLTIVDVTEKRNPVLVSKETYTGSSYTHQGWITEDHTVLLLDDELDEWLEYADERTRTYIWDIRSLQHPVLRNTYVSPLTSIDHNQYIRGDLSFQSNYEAGVRIMRINQQNFTLMEVAYFDVLPSKTEASFAGTWSNYPYYPSGNVVVSSIDYGLYILRPDYEAISQQQEPTIQVEIDYSEKSRTREIISAEEDWYCPPLSQTRPCVSEDTC